MPEEITGDARDDTKVIKKLTLPDGFRVGILNLNNILKEVAALDLIDSKTIKQELLKRVKECNYVASSAEQEYTVALFREYQRKWGKPDIDKELYEHQSGKVPGG